MAHTALPLAVFLALAAYDPSLDPREVSTAITMGQSPVESDRARFHRPYRLQISKPPVDSIEVFTPFRRVVQAAELRAQAGSRVFTQREGLDVARASEGQIAVVAEFTFHPLNTFVAVPAYEMVLIPAGMQAPVTTPTGIERMPRYALGAGPRQGRGNGEPLVGGTVTASFSTAGLNAAGSYDVVIREAGKELARAKLDLATLR